MAIHIRLVYMTQGPAKKAPRSGETVCNLPLLFFPSLQNFQGMTILNSRILAFYFHGFKK